MKADEEAFQTRLAHEREVGNPLAGLLDEAELKPRAFRAVAQDNVEALETVLRGVSPDVWSLWKNKAGKDLLSLSEDRGRHVKRCPRVSCWSCSSSCYLT